MKTIKNKTTLMKLLEMKNGELIEEQLRKLYVVEGLNIQDTAKALSVQPKTANNWLRLAGIERRIKYEKIIEYQREKKNEKSNLPI